MINENIAGGNWKELKGRIRSAWGKLTDDELESAKGDVSAIAGLIQRKYSTAQEDVRHKLNEWFAGQPEPEEPGSRLDRRPA
jgi:uncharacterized protein YjbJ (UPF0337 family)